MKTDSDSIDLSGSATWEANSDFYERRLYNINKRNKRSKHDKTT